MVVTARHYSEGFDNISFGKIPYENYYMKMGDKEKCLEELKRFFHLAEQVRAVAQSSDFNIAVRNPMYFSNISEEIGEEYMSNIYPKKVLGRYDAFFGEDEVYLQFKKTVIK